RVGQHRRSRGEPAVELFQRGDLGGDPVLLGAPRRVVRIEVRQIPLVLLGDFGAVALLGDGGGGRARNDGGGGPPTESADRHRAIVAARGRAARLPLPSRDCNGVRERTRRAAERTPRLGRVRTPRRDQSTWTGSP